VSTVITGEAGVGEGGIAVGGTAVAVGGMDVTVGGEEVAVDKTSAEMLQAFKNSMVKTKPMIGRNPSRCFIGLSLSTTAPGSINCQSMELS